MKLTQLISTVMLVASAHWIMAANWPQWRGPEFNGSSPEKDLPSAWTKEEAVWSVDMPGPSAATPIVWEDRVFVSTPGMATRTLHALCVDRKTGKVLWDKTVGEGLIQRDEKSNFAAPSPVANADLVVFFYSNGDLIAFNHQGQQLWSRQITKEFGDFAFQWTFSASPMLHGDQLYLQVLQRDVPVNGRGRKDGPSESFVLAMDPGTGKTLWRQIRPSEAVAESLEAYSTPIPFAYQGRHEILIAGGDCLTGHDPESGRELWRWGTWNPRKIGHWRLVPSPVTGAGVILACAPKGDPVYAIEAGGQGQLDQSAIAWKTDQQREVSADVPTPLFYQDDFFVLSDLRKNLSRLNPANGKVKWTLPLPGPKLEASPTGADGKIYLMNFRGDVFVVDAAEGKLLETIAMGEPGDDMTRSTIAAAHGQLFIRTNKKLYCVEKK